MGPKVCAEGLIAVWILGVIAPSAIGIAKLPYMTVPVRVVAAGQCHAGRSLHVGHGPCALAYLYVKLRYAPAAVAYRKTHAALYRKSVVDIFDNGFEITADI